MGSQLPQSRDRTHVPVFERQILNHWNDQSLRKKSFMGGNTGTTTQAQRERSSGCNAWSAGTHLAVHGPGAHDLSGSVSRSPSLLSTSVWSQTYILGEVSRIWGVEWVPGPQEMMMDSIGDFYSLNIEYS